VQPKHPSQVEITNMKRVAKITCLLLAFGFALGYCLFVGGLAGQALRRIDVVGRTVTAQEVVFNQFGRVRDIVQGPDGYFYIAVPNPTGVPNPAGGNISLSASTPGRIIRLVAMP